MDLRDHIGKETLKVRLRCGSEVTLENISMASTLSNSNSAIAHIRVFANFKGYSYGICGWQATTGNCVEGHTTPLDIVEILEGENLDGIF